MKTAFILYHINFEKTEKNRWKRKKKKRKNLISTLFYVAIGLECQLLTTLNIHASYDILEHKSFRMRG